MLTVLADVITRGRVLVVRK